jgi:hypothetical protein
MARILAISKSPTIFTAAPLKRLKFCQFTIEGKAKAAMIAAMAIATASSSIVKPLLSSFFFLILLLSIKHQAKLKSLRISVRSLLHKSYRGAKEVALIEIRMKKYRYENDPELQNLSRKETRWVGYQSYW